METLERRVAFITGAGPGPSRSHARRPAEQCADNVLPDVPWIEPSDVSEAVTRLCSGAARHITGLALPIDAGNTVKKG